MSFIHRVQPALKLPLYQTPKVARKSSLEKEVGLNILNYFS